MKLGVCERGVSFLIDFAHHIPVRYVNRGAVTIADCIVLTVTWMRTFRQWNEARRLKTSTPLAECLLRDGMPSTSITMTAH